MTITLSSQLKERLASDTRRPVPSTDDVDGFELWLTDLKDNHRDLYVEVATEIEEGFGIKTT